MRNQSADAGRQTIVSTCLPTIASEFEANQAEYTWVSVTYMLTQTAFQPLYGKLSDLIGRTVRVSLPGGHCANMF